MFIENNTPKYAVQFLSVNFVRGTRILGQDRHCTYNVTLRRFATIVGVGKPISIT